MKASRHIAAAVLAAAACASPVSDGPRDFPDPGPGGKTDALGRKLAGVASDYEAAELDELALVTDMRARRDAAWATVFKVLEPVPLLGLVEDDGGGDAPIELPGGVEIPKVPRFQTWYGVDDMKSMFQHLYEGLDASERAVRAAFTDEAMAEAVTWNASRLDRSSRWPLERYIKYVRELGTCPAEMSDDDCIALVQQRFGGAVGGNARILYSPATVDHVLRNYGTVLDCLGSLDTLTMDAQPGSATNFTLCFDRELPANSVLVKAQWARAEFGKSVPTYDTDADAMAAHLAGTAHWGDDGDRRTDPTPGEVFTIRLKNGDVYRLVGMHIMTKELRHWQWITLWWSDAPDGDFGADRPAFVRDGLDPVWANYKMCVVDGYVEQDADAAGRYADAPSLAAVLRAIDATEGAPTWCSNPYIEHGRNNARTNCIGCHQHGGSTVAFDTDGDGTPDPLDLEAIIGDEARFPQAGRAQLRELFPADYLYSFNRVDDFAAMIVGEVSYFDGYDRDSVRARVDHILGLEPDVAAGGETFSARCTGCHGPTGEGSGWAPSLYTRVPMRDLPSLAQTLLLGRGNMPSWADELNDQQLANVLGYLRATFGGED